MRSIPSHLRPIPCSSLQVKPPTSSSMLTRVLAATFSQFPLSWMPPCRLTIKQALLRCTMLALSLLQHASLSSSHHHKMLPLLSQNLLSLSVASIPKSTQPMCHR
uniref:LAC22 n=1 Tax=Arundo donax TaxID=35708 RepID=A0A0A9CA79_ARUDO